MTISIVHNYGQPSLLSSRNASSFQLNAGRKSPSKMAAGAAAAATLNFQNCAKHYLTTFAKKRCRAINQFEKLKNQLIYSSSRNKSQQSVHDSMEKSPDETLVEKGELDKQLVNLSTKSFSDMLHCS